MRERRISSFVEPGTDAPRPLASMEKKPSSLIVAAELPDEPPAPESEQPEGWYSTSLKIEKIDEASSGPPTEPMMDRVFRCCLGW